MFSCYCTTECRNIATIYFSNSLVGVIRNNIFSSAIENLHREQAMVLMVQPIGSSVRLLGTVKIIRIFLGTSGYEVVLQPPPMQMMRS